MTFLYIKVDPKVVKAFSTHFLKISPPQESWLNVLAALLMVVGATLTLTRTPCSDTALTVTSVVSMYFLWWNRNENNPLSLLLALN